MQDGGVVTVAMISRDACKTSISYGSWPQQWKRGEWVPIFKKDDHLNVKNYRPITILNAVDKIFEQL